ncbi:NAD(P)H-dependent oxidoreductase [Candidatus Woesearchaeota archaeon]|nr:NAD(P)H-dependent oxidoreductase [Candidatus Woesearchaeota archaeon]
MKTLIIYAHPETKGHCPLILKEMESLHKKEKIPYEVIDLYKIKYDPVLKASEHYTAGNRAVSGQNKIFQEKIRAADRLIFIHPVWWGSYPAVLKGFIDRVFTSGFAFNLKPLGFLGLAMPIKHLKGKKAAVLQTTGSPKIITATYLGNRFKKTLKHETFAFCGIKSRYFQIDKATQVTEKQVSRIKKEAKKAMGWLYS